MISTYTPPRRVQDFQELQVPEQGSRYSLAEICFVDGTTISFMVKAGPSVVANLVKDMHSTGYLVLWNDTDTLCVRAADIKHFCLREVTQPTTQKR